MRERLKSSVWAAIIMLVIGLCATLASYCQDHPKQHTETIEQQDEIRFMFVTVTDKMDDKVLYYRTGSKLIEISFLFWDKHSVYKDPDVKKPYLFKGCFMALTCQKHLYIYWLQRTQCSENTGSFYFNDK